MENEKMKILAIDTTTAVCSVAVVENDKILCEITLDYIKNHSLTLMPLIEQILQILNITIKDIDYISASVGPGSFTGLRVSAATVKALSHATGIPILPINTLDALAYNVCSGVVASIIDARRSEVFFSYYKSEDNTITRFMEYDCIHIDKVMEILKDCGEEVTFVGDGVRIHENIIKQNNYKIANSNNIMQRASSVGLLAYKMDKSLAVGYNDFEIFYMKKSQAEREYEEKNAK